MANSVDPDQTAPIGAICSWSTSKVRQLFAADDFSQRHFQMHFFLGALRVNPLSLWVYLSLFWAIASFEKKPLHEYVLRIAVFPCIHQDFFSQVF